MRHNRHLSRVWAAVWCLGSLGRGRRWLSIALIAFAVLWAQAELSPVGRPIARGTEASIRKTHNTVQWASFTLAIRCKLESVCLVPGGGFAGATATPSAVGDSGAAFYSEKSIARWDVVPYQTFTGLFKIGVVAFHAEGIDRVSFSVEGGPWKDATSMTLNDRTSVVEYWLPLKASLYPDGPIEVRAIAYPVNGVPRLLAGDTDSGNGEVSLFLNANAGGTLPENVAYVDSSAADDSGDGTIDSPFKTIMAAAVAIQAANGTGNADGGTIYLMAGNHLLGTYSGSIATTADRWLIITAAPGVAKPDAVITGSGDFNGIRTKLVRLYNLTITGGLSSTGDGAGEQFLWVDGCNIVGAGRTVQGDWRGGFISGEFMSDLDVTATMNGCGGSIQRNCNVHGIGQIAFAPGLVVNCTASNIDASGTTFHPDVCQLFGNQGNVILYNLTGIDSIQAQGIFTGDNIDMTDLAIINANIDNSITGAARCLSFNGPTRHALIKESIFNGGNNIFENDQTGGESSHFVGTNVVVDNTIFNPALSYPAGEVTFR